MGRPPIDGIVLASRKAALTTLTHLRARYGFPRPVLYNSHAEHEGRLSHPRLVVLLGGLRASTGWGGACSLEWAAPATATGGVCGTV